FLVNTFADTADVLPGDGVAQDEAGRTSLRAAIQEANALPGQDEILLSPGIYTLTIPGVGEDGAATGDLDITDDLAIRGADTGITVISGNRLDRVFDVLSGTLDLASLVVRDGLTSSEPGDDMGGGIRVGAYGQFRAFDVELIRNEATGDGGGLYNEGSSSILASTIAENTGTNGGGIKTVNGILDIAVSTISTNIARAYGGGIADPGELVGEVNLRNVTVVDNRAGLAAGGVDNSAGGPFAVFNTIIARNEAPIDPDVAGLFQSVGHNLIGDPGGSQGFGNPGDIVGEPGAPIDPRLGPLEYHAGEFPLPTRVHALFPDSPAVNAASPEGFDPVDQRGVPRPQGAAPDIGAFELEVGEIRGIKFEDVNGNGIRDFGEPGLSGWIIYLDANSNGVLEWADRDGDELWDPDEGERWTWTQADNPETANIDETGQYVFGDLLPGTYTVREVLPAGWAANNPGPEGYTVQLQPGGMTLPVPDGRPALGNNTIDNGLPEGDPGHFSVQLGPGGTTDTVHLAGTSTVFEYTAYLDVNAQGPNADLGAPDVFDLQDIGAAPTFVAGNFATSQATITPSTGGQIDVQIQVGIIPGTSALFTIYDFTASGGADLRNSTFWQYLDSDIYSSGDDELEVLGSVATNDLRLTTVDPTTNIRETQMSFPNLTGAMLSGWAAQVYSDLQDNILSDHSGRRIHGHSRSRR
ncbi:MAG: hypothetical protein GXP27_20620, partial [Planctomycetes bacterium]|nr:hypothetical protein [Planctomycetota bacterium]